MVMIRPSAGNTLTLRVSLQRVPGTLGKLTSALGAAALFVKVVEAKGSYAAGSAGSSGGLIQAASGS